MALIADWMQLGCDVFYRKPELYSMGWGGGLNLDDFLIAAAPLGGPIALIRNDATSSKAVTASKPLIFIFSASGLKISSFKWSSGILVHVGWSRNEELVFIQEDGMVLLYDLFGKFIHTFNMGQEVKDTQVQKAQIFTGFQETGVAVITKANQIFVVNNIKDPKPRKYSGIPNIQGSCVICWCALREERHTSIVVSIGKDLLLLNHQEQIPQNLKPDWVDGNRVVVDIAVSTNSRHIAIYSESSQIWIGSSDLCTKYCEFTTKSTIKPKQIAWCGTGAVALLWDMTLELVSVNGDTTTIYLDSGSYLIQELDSVRIISSATHDLLQKVPVVVVETLGIGSMAPGALLFEASQGYQEGSTRATDCLGMIKDSLEEAIIQCYQSAQHEFSPSTQKALLRAALFGKSFKPEMDPEACKTVITTLRVLNGVRDHRVGLPLTWNQLEWMTIPILLDRLLLRRLFPIALRISSFLKIPECQGTSRILAHWACQKIKEPSQKPDEVIAKEINAKLGYTQGISYTDIANRAEQVGRNALAIKLIEYECRPSKQVPVLLRLGEDQMALKRALQSGDSDLIYTVLLHLRNKLSLADFLMLIRNFNVALSLHMKNCHENDTDQLRDILIQEDDFHGQALLRIKEAYEAVRIDSQLASLQMAGECFKKTKDEFSSLMTEDQVKLIKIQVSLEEKFQKSYLNLSLHDSILQLIHYGHLKEAEKLKTDFRVPDKRFCYLQVLGHGQSKRWAELNVLSKTKKLVIGFEAFVDVCLKYDNHAESLQYLTKVKEENRITYHLRCGLFEEALNIAIEQKNGAGLIEIASACGLQNQSLQLKIQNLLVDPSFRQ